MKVQDYLSLSETQVPYSSISGGLFIFRDNLYVKLDTGVPLPFANILCDCGISCGEFLHQSIQVNKTSRHLTGDIDPIKIFDVVIGHAAKIIEYFYQCIYNTDQYLSENIPLTCRQPLITGYIQRLLNTMLNVNPLPEKWYESNDKICTALKSLNEHIRQLDMIIISEPESIKGTIQSKENLFFKAAHELEVILREGFDFMVTPITVC